MAANKTRVQVRGSIGKSVRFPTGTSGSGATLGLDFMLPDGSVPTLQQLAAALATGAATQDQPGNILPPGGGPATIWQNVQYVPANVSYPARPIMEEDAGEDYYRMPAPGPIGPIGLTPAVIHLAPDDPDDPMIVPGAPGNPGAQGAPGGQGVFSTVHMYPDEPEDAAIIPGAPGNPGAQGPPGVGLTGAIGAIGPAIWYTFDDPEDPPSPIPGAQGIQGIQGIPGTGGGTSSSTGWVQLEDYDPEDLVRGNPTDVGPLSVQNILAVNGNMTFDAVANRTLTFTGASPTIQATAAAAVLTINAISTVSINANNVQLLTATVNGVAVQNGAASNPQLTVQAGFGVGSSYGLLTQSGKSSTDYNWLAKNANGTTQFMEVFGDGGVTIGASTVVDKGPGTLNVQNGIYVNGNLMPQTDPYTNAYCGAL